jgi:hypothetical protein
MIEVWAAPPYTMEGVRVPGFLFTPSMSLSYFVAGEIGPPRGPVVAQSGTFSVRLEDRGRIAETPARRQLIVDMAERADCPRMAAGRRR